MTRPALVLALPLALPLAGALPAQAAPWNVDPAHSRIGFAGSQGGAPFTGSFKHWDAKIDFDPANPAAGHALVTIDMASAATGDSDKDGALPQAEWFDTAAFPQAVFEATTFRAKGGNAYEAVGTLTIRGIKKDVTLPFTLDTTGPDAHALGRLTLVRTDYAIGQGAWARPDVVALEVAVTVDLAATKGK